MAGVHGLGPLKIHGTWNVAALVLPPDAHPGILPVIVHPRPEPFLLNQPDEFLCRHRGALLYFNPR